MRTPKRAEDDVPGVHRVDRTRTGPTRESDDRLRSGRGRIGLGIQAERDAQGRVARGVGLPVQRNLDRPAEHGRVEIAGCRCRRHTDLRRCFRTRDREQRDETDVEDQREAHPPTPRSSPDIRRTSNGIRSWGLDLHGWRTPRVGSRALCHASRPKRESRDGDCRSPAGRSEHQRRGRSLVLRPRGVVRCGVWLLLLGSRWIIASLCALGLIAGTVPYVRCADPAGRPRHPGWELEEPEGGAAAGPTGPSRSPVGTPVLGSCGDRIDGGRCGTIEVWADSRFPNLGTLQVGFVRFPRLDRQTPSQGTIVAVEGGPGYSTIGSRSWYLDLFRPLMQHRSLLLMDLRGNRSLSARSIAPPSRPGGRTTTRCRGPRPRPPARNSWAPWRLATVPRSPPTTLPPCSTASHVDGIDLYGDSYGTFFAQTFAVRHPDLVDTLTLDAAYPIEGTDAWWRDLNRAALAAIRRSCERDPTCHGHTIAVLRDLVRRVRRDPDLGRRRPMPMAGPGRSPSPRLR